MDGGRETSPRPPTSFRARISRRSRSIAARSIGLAGTGVTIGAGVAGAAGGRWRLDRGRRRRQRRRVVEQRRERAVLLRLREILVVLGALLLRREHVVRERDAREDRLDLVLERAELFPEVAVGVELGRELVVRGLDRLLLIRVRDAEELVVRELTELAEELEDARALRGLDVDLLVAPEVSTRQPRGPTRRRRGARQRPAAAAPKGSTAPLSRRPGVSRRRRARRRTRQRQGPRAGRARRRPRPRRAPSPRRWPLR